VRHEGVRSYRLGPHERTKCVRCNATVSIIVSDKTVSFQHMLSGIPQLPDVTKCVTTDAFCALVWLGPYRDGLTRPFQKAGDPAFWVFKFLPDPSLPSASVVFLLGLIFDSEDIRGMFLRNTGTSIKLRGGLISLWFCTYSTYSPLNSTHLWLRCSNFFNSSKKNFLGCVAKRVLWWFVNLEISGSAIIKCNCL
jgi:hypothetical protein